MRRFCIFLTIILSLFCLSCERELPPYDGEIVEKPEGDKDTDKEEDDTDEGTEGEGTEGEGTEGEGEGTEGEGEGENSEGTEGEGSEGEGTEGEGSEGEGSEGEGSEGEGTEGEGTVPEHPEPVTGKVPVDELYGYADGTTGGEGGSVIHFNDGDAFCSWLKLREKNKSKEPVTVWLSGTFTSDQGRDSSSPWFDIKRTHNLTILGVDGFVMDRIGFFLNEASNIIIRNIHIKQPKADNGADAISIQESNNIWIDHCTFESLNQTKDYEDGSCDVTHESYNVTISWCKYLNTQKSTLVGHSNSATSDTKITVTMHHNWFDGSSSRHPRVRFGRAHVYNNLYDGCTTYGVGSAYGAKVLVEYNLFDNVRLPIDICTFPAKKSGNSWVSNLTGSVAGYVFEHDNEFINKPSNASDPYPFSNLEYSKYGSEPHTALTFNDFAPSYEYVVEDNMDDLRASIESYSGAGGGILGYTSAPVEPENGGSGDDGTGEGDSGDSGNSGEGDGSDDSGEGGSGEGDDNGSGGEGGNAGTEIGGGWTATFCGDKTSAASVSDGKLTIVANGKFESGAQSFGYVYREVSGDFTATVMVESFDYEKGDTNQGLAGILMSPDISKTGTDFIHAMAARSKASYYYSYRLATGDKASKGALSAPETTGNKVVVKLRREGDVCYASYSLDGGSTFGNEKKNTISGLPEKVYLGLAANGADNSESRPGTAVFSGFTLNGTQYGF